MLTRARTNVDDVVGGANGVLVVLDDDQRVTQIPQPHQRLDESSVVALVEPDGRLIQHIQHPDQTRSDLGRQANALRLPARQRGRRTREGEVIQADIQ